MIKTNKIIPYIIILIPLMLSGQSYYFNEIYQSSSYTWSAMVSLIETGDGYIVGGVTGHKENEFWHQLSILHLDKNGDLINEILIGDTISEYYFANKPFVKVPDEDIYFTGTRITYFEDFNHYEISLNKFNDEYDTLWTKYYGDNILPIDSAYGSRQIILTTDTNFLIVGTMVPEIDYRNNMLLMKIDGDGNKISEWLYTHPNSNYKLNGYSVIETPDKGYAVGAYGYIFGFSYTAEPMVYKVDSAGNEEWHIYIGGPYFDDIPCLCNSYDGNIIAAVCVADSMSGNYDAYRTITVQKIDLEGNMLWEHRYCSSNFDNSIGNIRKTNDGGYILCGTYFTAPGALTPWRSGWMLKITAAGDSLWFRGYNYYYSDPDDENYLYDVIPTNDNGYAACGQVFGDATGWVQRAWVLKVDSMGCDTPGCATGTFVKELSPSGGGRGEEFRIWPNPVREEFWVKPYAPPLVPPNGGKSSHAVQPGGAYAST